MQTTEEDPTEREKLLLRLLGDGGTVRDNTIDGRRWVRLAAGGTIGVSPEDWDGLVARGWGDRSNGKITPQGRRMLGRSAR